MLGLRIHAARASYLSPLSIPGNNNTMADISTRAFRTGDYFDATWDLTSFFNSQFPLPQGASWQTWTLLSKLTSRTMTCMLGKQLTMNKLLKLPGLAKNTGSIGN
eukprot:12883754-Ditylum_brightwellii.AAC.1